MGESQLKQKTAKGLVWGGLGNCVYQLLNLVFGIFLTRMLSPADYGITGSLVIFSVIAGMLSDSGFVLAIVNRRMVSDDDYNAVFWFNVVVSSVIYILLWFSAPLIARFYNQPEMVWVSRFVFIGFVVSALSSTPTAYFFRNLQVKMRISIQMTALLISGVVGVICAFMGMRYWSLAIQTVVYTSTNSLLLWIKCPWRPKFSLHFAPLMEMLPFSIKQLVVSFFTHVNNNVFQVLLGRFYGMATTGYYTQGQKWTAMGYSTLNGMLNNVGQPVFRQTIDDQQRLHRVFSRLLRFTCLVSFPAMFGLAIVSKELIVLTVTDKWLQSVPVMSILCIGGAFLPIATLYGNLFNSVGRPSVYMWNTIILGLIQVGVLFAIIPLGLYTMLKVYITINIAWLIVWQLFARRLVGIRFRKVAADITPYLLISMAVMGMTVFVASSITDVILALLVKMAVAAALYILAIRIFLPQDFKEAINFIRHR